MAAKEVIKFIGKVERERAEVRIEWVAKRIRPLDSIASIGLLGCTHETIAIMKKDLTVSAVD